METDRTRGDGFQLEENRFRLDVRYTKQELQSNLSLEDFSVSLLLTTAINRLRFKDIFLSDSVLLCNFIMKSNKFALKVSARKIIKVRIRKTKTKTKTTCFKNLHSCITLASYLVKKYKYSLGSSCLVSSELTANKCF